MPLLVVPFRGAKGKSRLGPLPPAAREVLAAAMLGDVVAACTAVGSTFVVGSLPELDLLAAEPLSAESLSAESFSSGLLSIGHPVELVADPGGGQGPAVRAGLAAAALAGGGVGPLLVVNADLPCVTARDLFALAGAVPDGGLAYAPAGDGTTNALALSSSGIFVPVYGPGSAERFAALAPSLRVDAPNLMDDVDTIADLERLRGRLGPRTRSVLTSLRSVLAALHVGAAA